MLLDGPDLSALAAMMQGQQCVSLHLSACSLTPTAVERLSHIPALQHLHLASCSLSDDMLELLVRALRAWNVLLSLDVSHTGAAHDTIAALRDWLGLWDCSLQRLYLDGCKVGDIGSTELCCGLEEGARSLRVLGLRGCGLGAKGAKALLSAAQRNARLLHAHVDYSTAPPSVLEALQTALTVNAQVRPASRSWALQRDDQIDSPMALGNRCRNERAGRSARGCYLEPFGCNAM
jgi:hypothetical protein